MSQHRRDDHAAGLARPRRTKQQYRSLGPREPPLSIVPCAEPYATAGARGERTDRTQRVRASRDHRRPWSARSSMGREDRVDHDDREDHEDQRDRDVPGFDSSVCVLAG